MSTDIDTFLSDLFGSTKKASTDFDLSSAAMGRVFGTPDPFLEEFEKVAHDEAGFLSQFEGTPLFPRAVQLIEESLKIEAARLQNNINERARDEGRDDIWNERDQIRIKKKQLELELAKSKAHASIAPKQPAAEPGPVAPTAPATGSPAAEKLSALLEECSMPSSKDASFLAQFEGTPLFPQAVALLQQEVANEEKDLQRRAESEADRKARPNFWDQEQALDLEKRKLELELATLKLQGAQPAEEASPEAKVAAMVLRMRGKTAGRKLSAAQLEKLANIIRNVSHYLPHAPASLVHSAGGAAQSAAKAAIPRNAAEFAAHAPASLRQSAGRAMPPPVPGRAVPPPVPAAAARPAPAAGGDLFAVPAGPSRFSGQAPVPARPMPAGATPGAAAYAAGPQSLSGQHFMQNTPAGRQILEGGVQPTHELAMQGPQGLAVAKRVGAGREVAAAQRSMATGGQGEVLAGTYGKQAALELLAELREKQAKKHEDRPSSRRSTITTAAIVDGLLGMPRAMPLVGGLQGYTEGNPYGEGLEGAARGGLGTYGGQLVGHSIGRYVAPGSKIAPFMGRLVGAGAGYDAAMKGLRERLDEKWEKNQAAHPKRKTAGKLFSLFSGAAGEAAGRAERMAAMDAKNKAKLVARSSGGARPALPSASAGQSGVRPLPAAPAGSVQAQRYAKRRELTGAGDGWVG